MRHTRDSGLDPARPVAGHRPDQQRRLAGEQGGHPTSEIVAKLEAALDLAPGVLSDCWATCPSPSRPTRPPWTSWKLQADPGSGTESASCSPPTMSWSPNVRLTRAIARVVAACGSSRQRAWQGAGCTVPSGDRTFPIVPSVRKTMLDDGKPKASRSTRQQDGAMPRPLGSTNPKRLGPPRSAPPSSGCARSCPSNRRSPRPSSAASAPRGPRSVPSSGQVRPDAALWRPANGSRQQTASCAPCSRW